MGAIIDALITYYDGEMYRPLHGNYYGQSDYYNFGYWLTDTQYQNEACENLMEELLAFIPEKIGTILDVACGMGATTRYLLKYYSARDVTGINISEKQLTTSRINSPGCEFILMSAAALAFEDGLFDNLICVEAAFHFDTRQRFVEEAFRVLKPGGRLVLSDIMFTRLPRKSHSILPESNFVEDLKEYRNVYQRAGFEEVEIVDVTNVCWKGFRRQLFRWICKGLLKRNIDVREALKQLVWLWVMNVIVRHYLLVSARKR